MERNRTREEVLSELVCPFLAREIAFVQGQMFNMGHIGGLRIYETEKPVDSDWPIKRTEFLNSEGNLRDFEHQRALLEALKDVAEDVTGDIFREGTLLIESGGYKEMRVRVIESTGERYAFFICPFGDDEVDHNYEYVIKPAVKQHQFKIERADEISHTREITEIILEAISRSRFIIADLTNALPNCYYELGYAHALRKPVIILAKAGTQRHFDISTYKWNYWGDYTDLKPTVEKELESVVRALAPSPMLNSAG